MVVGEAAIAMQLIEAGEEAFDIVECVRPVRMACDENALPWRQVGIELAADLLGARPQRLDGSLTFRRAWQHAERFDLFQQHADRFFELE